MPTLALRHRIYQECAAFLTAYRNNDLPKLARHYGLSTNVVRELDEQLDFVGNKATLHLFAETKINSNLNGDPYLTIDDVDGDYLIECVVLDEQNYPFYLLAEYNRQTDGSYQFEFRSFDI